MTLEETLALRTAQLAAVTDEMRDDDDESNPIIYAEHGPNRFAVMSLFFSDSDGVRIEEHLGLQELEVVYFDDHSQTVLTEGPLYDWAVKFFQDNF